MHITMRLQYLLDERTKYEGCVPLRFGDKKQSFFLQPPEVVELCLDEVIKECVLLELELSTESRIDDHGRFYKVREGADKNGMPKDVRYPAKVLSIPEFLDHLRGKGYAIPNEYWSENKESLMKEIALMRQQMRGVF